MDQLDGARVLLVDDSAYARRRLAGADGYSLMMRSIRGGAVAGSVAIRSIAMTAHADTETRQKALEAGFDDFLPKLVGALLVPAVARLRQPT